MECQFSLHGAAILAATDEWVLLLFKLFDNKVLRSRYFFIQLKIVLLIGIDSAMQVRIRSVQKLEAFEFGNVLLSFVRFSKQLK